MNLLSKSAWSVAAATVTLTAAAMAIPQSADAFVIKSSTGTNYPGFGTSNYPNATVTNQLGQQVSSGLSAPTTINFDSGNLGDQNVAASNPNGSATFAEIGGGGSATVNGGILVLGGGNGNGANTTGGTGITFGRNQGYFGLQWLTPNANDTITFGRSSGGTTPTITTIATITAQDLANQGKLTLNSTQTTYIEFFVSSSNEIFNYVSLNDPNNANNVAFRVDNVAYQAIPTPALLPGAMAMGLGLLRRRKSESEAAEA